ncbi:hypothetical protein BJ508DRAFT_329298 [Ascobolus immersus RN42]|uniref:F-box domain-containing protein n=1 Tax=Ascobolus immersus RN42 TaxID=1160509 RepID=A0A3N4HYU9_ASCIM|nr:hypothetical protein BJ508DRAFT_329298 [Ascobolus immersus RN42]
MPRSKKRSKNKPSIAQDAATSRSRRSKRRSRARKQTNLTNTPILQKPATSLLSLPTELLLEIYGHCSAFTLLQLSHTHPRLYAEINDSPKILNKAYGYSEKSLDNSRRSVFPDAQARLWQRTYLKPQPPVRRKDNSIALLTIFHIYRICSQNAEEQALFQRRYRRLRDFDAAHKLIHAFSFKDSRPIHAIVPTKITLEPATMNPQASNDKDSEMSASNAPNTSSAIFNLPLELRWMIYRQCTAFTLLQLFDTHPKIRDELHADPSIIEKSFGFFDIQRDAYYPLCHHMKRHDLTNCSIYSYSFCYIRNSFSSFFEVELFLRSRPRGNLVSWVRCSLCPYIGLRPAGKLQWMHCPNRHCPQAVWDFESARPPGLLYEIRQDLELVEDVECV